MARTHVVQAGECLSSISFEYGFFVDTLWDHPQNGSLKELRKNPVVLRAGDEVFIPDTREKTVRVATGKRHTFRRKGVPALFKVRLSAGESPRAGVAFTLLVDGVSRSGRTDADGRIQVYLSPAARTATLVVHDSAGEERYELTLGHMDPVTELTGVQARLKNLGFWPGEVDGEEGDALRAAVRAFQEQHGLSPGGELDGATRDALVAAFGG